MAGRSVIVSAVRTPFGKLGGGLAKHPATELGAIAIKAALERIGVEAHEPQYVIMGQVLQAGAGQAPARQAAIGAGLPKETPADTINKVCASSIRAIEIADSMIRAGDVDVVVTGGMESMSNAPYLLKQARFGYRLGHGELIDSMVFDGLTSTFDELHMVAAEREGLPRARHHARAAGLLGGALARARGGGAGRGPLRRRARAGRRRQRRRVGAARHDASRSSRRLKPVFDPEGTTTAGNAPGVNDGASCVIVCSEEWAGDARSRAARDDPLAGLRRRRLRLPRTHACERGRDGARTRRQVDRRRASGSRSTRRSRPLRGTRRSCSAPTSRQVNVNGGAVALGHPIGASGGRIVSTMVHELRRSGGGLGLAAICSGGGQGDALLIEV